MIHLKAKRHDAVWFFSPSGCVGIVMVDDEFYGVKYYIGQCAGENEKEDINHITMRGSPFPAAVGALLFGPRESVAHGTLDIAHP